MPIYNLTLAGISAIPRFNKSFANSRISVRSNKHVHTRKQHCFEQSRARMYANLLWKADYEHRGDLVYYTLLLLYTT